MGRPVRVPIAVEQLPPACREIHLMQTAGLAAKRSAIIAADVRRFSYLINTDEVFGTHSMAVQNGGLWVQSPELELRDFPGDTPNRLRKARAKELSES